jgi:Amt family ammonium transporter
VVKGPWLVVALLCFFAAPLGHAAGRPVDYPSYDLYLDRVLFDESFFAVSNLWGVIAAGLMFLMHLGFATLEAGFARARNVVNILYKNIFVVCLALVAYAAFGFHTMFPGEFNGWWHPGGWFGVPVKDYFDLMTPRYDQYTWWTDFLFQSMVAAKAATIVSGAVGERQKLSSFLIFAVLFTAFAYPVAGAWSWGKGWLFRQGFIDFAGTAVVHVFGGFAALAGVLLLGPRRGKYDADGKSRALPGHSMPLAAIGLFILWFGWLGFNGGSLRSAHPELLGLVAVNTCLGGAAGGLGAMLLTQFLLRKPDLSMAINGVLAGLVAVTGCADIILPHHALLAGVAGGAIVVLAVLVLDRLQIDDPIGAIPVHAIGGLWGTLVPAIFAGGNWKWQALGAATYALSAFVFSFLVFGALKLTVGIRVSEEAERTGLDITTHGQEAYATDAGANA